MAPREWAEARESSWDLGLGLSQCHFVYLLLFKVRNKVSPDSTSRETDSTFYVKNCKVTSQRGVETGRERILASSANNWSQCVLRRNLKAATTPGAGAHTWAIALVTLDADLWEVLLLPLLPLSRNPGVHSLTNLLKLPQMFWEQIVACSHCCCLYCYWKDP